MKAVSVTKFAPIGTVPTSVSFGSITSPPPPVKNQLIIAVKASSINVDDVALLQDSAGGGWFFHGRTPTAANPLVGGMEYSGVVESCGPSCKKFKVGDRVVGLQDLALQKNPGTWAEKTMAPETDVVPLPSDISFVEGASIGMGAYISGDLFKRGGNKLKQNGGKKRILLIGASGGLGTILLKLLENDENEKTVVAVCSGSNVEMVKRLGAHEVIDYKKGTFGEQLCSSEKFDIVYDYVGGKDTERSARKLLKNGGQFITAVGPLQGVGDKVLSCWEWTGWCCGLTCAMTCSPCSRTSYEMGGGMPPLKEADFNAVAVEAKIRAEIALELPFTEEAVREGLKKVASRHAGGKVVLNMEKMERD